MRPLVAVTAIPRPVLGSLPVAVASATSYDGFGRLVSAAGGVPVYADAFADPAELAARVDALVLSGGSDVDPALYGAPPHVATTWSDPGRDAFEAALLREALARSLPVLGVCRGMQLLNVVLGGTLVQDLPAAGLPGHSDPARFDAEVHGIAVDRTARLAGALARAQLVNTLHHQAVDRLGDGLRVAAWAADGVVEAVESADGRWLGVQWHPELLAPAAQRRHLPLFRALLSPR